MISAEVICDSISAQEKRPLTYRLRYPKFIHGEVKTHRVIRATNEGGYFVLEQETGFMDDPNLSRNASSSRAIPVHKLIQEVRDEASMVYPVYFGKEQKGMQSGEAFVGEELKGVMLLWRDAALSAADHAERMVRAGIHKSIVNRIIEPFSHINVVCTATEYDNFFGLRLHKDAQPEARALAIAMWEGRKASTPKLLNPGTWHLPFVWKEGGNEQVLDQLLPPGNPQGLTPGEQMVRMSVARCARVSYQSFETGKPSTMDEDLKLYARLVSSQPLHASPAEHQCTPDFWLTDTANGRRAVFQRQHEWGNLQGWRQFRKMLPGEAVAPLPGEYW